MKKILLFSYNPVPTEQYTTVEGSALRFWRMAQAIRSESKDYDITIAIWEKFNQECNESQGIKITSFDADPNHLKQLAQGYDCVIFSCAMGGLSRTIFDSIGRGTQIIIDAYSPMYVEFLTKSLDAKADVELLEHYYGYVEAFNYCLVRADKILVANSSQKHFYRGVLGGIGALPHHDDSRFVELPAFVEYDSQVNKNVGSIKDKVEVLWFGGVYPWFDIEDLILAFSDKEIIKLANLKIVGGSNPFYPKDNVRYNGKYMNAVAMSKKLGLKDKNIFFDDWVEYNNRIDKINAADVAISINNDFIENEYSFRLRVADLVGNCVPLITNGGDVLGEWLIDEGVAFKIDLSSPDKLKASLKKVLENKRALIDARKKLHTTKLGERLHINWYISRLTEAMSDINNRGASRDNKAFDGVQQVGSSEYFPKSINIHQMSNVSTSNLLRVTARRLSNATKSKAKNILHKR